MEPESTAARGRQDEQDDPEDARVEEVMRQGPVGTWAVAGLATFIVMAIYLLFYLLAYLPRGQLQ